MHKSLVRWVILSGVLTWGATNEPSALAVPFTYHTGSQAVTGTIYTPPYTDQGQTYGPFGSTYGYTQTFDGSAVVRHVELNFAFDPTFTTAQGQTFRAAAESSIEGIWNNRAIITDTANQRSFPLRVEVTTTGPFVQSRRLCQTRSAAEQHRHFVRRFDLRRGHGA